MPSNSTYVEEILPDTHALQVAEGDEAAPVKLVSACLRGDREEAEPLLGEVCHLNIPVNVKLAGPTGGLFKGMTPFMAATYSQNRNLVSLLADLGANVNYKSPENSLFPGWTALHICGMKGDALMYACLQRHGARHTKAANGLSMTGIAVQYGHCTFGEQNWVNDSCSGPNDWANAVEVMGTLHVTYDCINSKDADRCVELWEAAILMRKVFYRNQKKEVEPFQGTSEIETTNELRTLQASKDLSKLYIQCALMNERVCGKQSRYSAERMLLYATKLSANREYQAAVSLFFRIVNNISDSWHLIIYKIETYYRFVECLVMAELYNGGLRARTFANGLQFLRLAATDFQRAILEPVPPENEELESVYSRRLRETILQLICLLHNTSDCPQPEDRVEASEIIKGMRNQHGESLLHMACKKDIHIEDRFQHCLGNGNFYNQELVFDALEIVRALIGSGCDVQAENEDGQTALQIVLERQDDNAPMACQSQIVEILGIVSLW